MQTRTKGTEAGRPAAQILALILVLISISAWGLQYKLSLYRVHDSCHSSVPAAKLLSPRERITRPSQASAVFPAVPHPWMSAGLSGHGLFSEPAVRFVSLPVTRQTVVAQAAIHVRPLPRPPPARS
jgi:hypothetical protein